MSFHYSLAFSCLSLHTLLWETFPVPVCGIQASTLASTAEGGWAVGLWITMAQAAFPRPAGRLLDQSLGLASLPAQAAVALQPSAFSHSSLSLHVLCSGPAVPTPSVIAQQPPHTCGTPDTPEAHE